VIYFVLFCEAAIAKNEKAVPLEKPAIFDNVVKCRQIVDPTERLACFDAKVAALDEAQSKEEILITDRAAVAEARKGLFGFSLPKLKIFGSEGETEIDQINASISKAYQNSNGMWVITLEDGAKWQQIDTRILVRDPRSGMSILIKRAALGSYFVKVENQVAIRMRRVN
jgi:hypothetical protein